MAWTDRESRDRRKFLQRSAAMGGMALLGGCASSKVVAPAVIAATQVNRMAWRPEPQLAPIRASVDRIMNITVCLRPFRAAGPRLDAEMVGDKLVAHNYGHGGSGWSLSWGSGLIAVKTALAGGAKDVAVLGCGALGLTAATLAQRAGARVTIYCKERMPDVRSARATGLWTPDSRIALESKAAPGFPALWEQMARDSFRIHQHYIGLADAPVEWTDRYTLRDTPPVEAPDPLGFVRYGRLIRDLTPPGVTLPPGSTPFQARGVVRASLPMFNITEYGHVLMNDFLIGGGKIEMREFHTPGELTQLPQPVIINCTGYGARALWKDESLTPVRGQLTWLIPQPEVTYGIFYRGVSTVSRRDGLIVQNVGPDDGYGLGDDREVPDRAEAEAAVKTVASVFPQT